MNKVRSSLRPQPEVAGHWPDLWLQGPIAAPLKFWAIPLLMLACHLAVWIWAAHQGGISWKTLLGRWDSGWYTSIVESGYTAQSAAFYPLFPSIAGLLAQVTGLPTALAGTVTSVACFLGFVGCVGGCLSRQTAIASETSSLLPASPMAWLVFIFSPASYAFHSHHTESLFLLLSFLALQAGAEKRLMPAAVLGGLAALTRNQGVLVAAAAALFLVQGERGWKRNLWRFVLCGAVSASIYSAYPVYLWTKLGDPFALFAAQGHWSHARSAAEYFGTFLFLNPWQNLRPASILHLPFVLALLAFSVLLIRRSPPAAAYCLGTVLLFPMQGEFVSTFRYGTVLFPVLFLAGDFVGRLPLWARAPLIVAAIGVNLLMANAYAWGRWAY